MRSRPPEINAVSREAGRKAAVHDGGKDVRRRFAPGAEDSYAPTLPSRVGGAGVFLQSRIEPRLGGAPFAGDRPNRLGGAGAALKHSAQPIDRCRARRGRDSGAGVPHLGRAFEPGRGGILGVSVFATAQVTTGWPRLPTVGTVCVAEQADGRGFRVLDPLLPLARAGLGVVVGFGGRGCGGGVGGGRGWAVG